MRTLAIVALLCVTMSAVIASITLGFYVRLIRAEFADRTDEMKAAWAKREDWWMRQHDTSLARWEAERETLRHQHALAVQAEHERHAAEVERLTNLLTLGSTARKDAVISDGEPDAESRVLKRISEDTIEAGIVALTAEYAERGIHVSAEEVRDEVISMIMGSSFTPNENVSLTPAHSPEVPG
jgi:hypothetical protein